MDLNQRIESLVKLGNRIEEYLNSDRNDDDMELFDSVLRRAEVQNRWFSKDNILFSLSAIRGWLKEDELIDWTSHYITELKQNSDSKVVGIIMAGNIPLVGFHDLLASIITGNRILAKTSTDDAILTHFVVSELKKMDARYEDVIQLTEGMIKDFDVVIATGSNNTSRYFEQYFSKYPNIIRKNRHSVAVLTGNESKEDLLNLGNDIFQYFGLGCRNVSKLFIPENYDFDLFFQTMMNFDVVGQNQKYINNVDYHKAILLVNRVKFLDGGTLLLTESKDLHSPVGVLNYTTYSDESEIDKFINSNKDQIQCVVGEKYIDFGKAQSPGLMDYADGVDVMRFLLG